MQFRTQVELPKKGIHIDLNDRILLIGSCFAENIGNFLVQNKFNCDMNPYGVLYNPLSVLQALKEIQKGYVYKPEDLFYFRDQYHSSMHHSCFSGCSSNEVLSRINYRLQRASENFSSNSLLILTFGSSFVYESKETDGIVGNCHKQPAACFNRRLLSIKEIVEEYSRFFKILFKENPALKVLFTISPIRHLKDGLHRNQISKSILLLSIDELLTIFPDNLFYFPSYEIVLDELRDYRFYDSDMLHPSKVAIEYIWECFGKSYFDLSTQMFLKEWKEIRNGLNHKPFRANSDEYKSFLNQLVLKIKAVKEKYPNLDVDKEMEVCHTLLKL